MRPTEIAFALVALPTSPSAEESLCRDRGAFAAELHVSPDGSWSILETFSGGLACKFAEGDALEFVYPVIVPTPEQGS